MLVDDRPAAADVGQRRRGPVQLGGAHLWSHRRTLPTPSASIRAPRTRRISASGTRPTHQPRGHLPDRRRRRTAASTAIPASRNRRKVVMCPKAASTTTPNRIAASAPRLGTRRGLRSTGWTRSLRLMFRISTNTYSSWLWFIGAGLYTRVRPSTTIIRLDGRYPGGFQRGGDLVVSERDIRHRPGTVNTGPAGLATRTAFLDQQHLRADPGFWLVMRAGTRRRRRQATASDPYG
jgi:hypothetical protein